MRSSLADFNPQMETFEFEGELGETEAEVFNEAEQMELAAELLEIRDEAELEQFLGKLIKKAGGAIGKFVKSPVGKAIGGFLKAAAKKVLPMAGAALGGMVGGPIGAKLGSGLANVAGSALGLELEGLSHEDREFEAARQFVRLSGECVKQTLTIPAAASRPATAAQQGFQEAARRFAPGLIGGPSPIQHHARRGRWFRQGRNLLVTGI